MSNKPESAIVTEFQKNGSIWLKSTGVFLQLPKDFEIMVGDRTLVEVREGEVVDELG